jgi:hypothetical protein
MNWQDVLKAIIPVLVACLAWLLGQVSDFSTRLTKIEGSMPALITPGPDAFNTREAVHFMQPLPLQVHSSGSANVLSAFNGINPILRASISS